MLVLLRGVMAFVFILHFLIVGLGFALAIQILITNNSYINLLLLSCFWLVNYLLIDFIILIFCAAKRCPRFFLDDLSNKAVLIKRKTPKIFISEIFDEEILILEGPFKRKSIVIGKNILERLTEKELKSGLIYLLTYSHTNSFLLRSLITSVNAFSYMLISKFGPWSRKLFETYYSLLFNFMQIFPLKIQDNKSAINDVLMLEGTVELVRSFESKLFLNNRRYQKIDKKILFPITSKSISEEIIIDDISLKINESFN